MIVVYGPAESTFTSMGIGAVSPSSCVVTEELNGRFDLELTHPRDEGGKWVRLVEDNIITAPTHRGTQPFRIFRVEVDAMGEIKVNARHLFYDLGRNLLDYVGAGDAQTVGDAMLAACQYASGFTFVSALTDSHHFTWNRVNPVQALLGDDGMTDRWKGEVERDGTTVTLLSRLGADNGVRIAYKKNLTGLVVTTDATDLATRLRPWCKAADGTDLYLPEDTIDSPLVDNYALPVVRALDCSDVVVGSEDYPEATDAYAEMRARVAAAYARNVDLPLLSLDVEFVSWERTAEYAAYAPLLTVTLGDTVTIEHEPLAISMATRVVRVEYDSLILRHVGLTTGETKPTLSQQVSSLSKSVVDLESAAADTSRELGNTQADLSIVDAATYDLNRVMATSMGYYCTVVTNALTGARTQYIHDQVELENSLIIYTMTAQGFAWTNAGWNGGAPTWQYGYSASGNAILNILTVTGLVADWIKAGTLSSVDGNISLGLATGIFTLGKHLLDIAAGTLKFTSSQHDTTTDYEWKRSGGDKALGKFDGTLKTTEAFAWGDKLRAEVRDDADNEGVDFTF